MLSARSENRRSSIWARSQAIASMRWRLRRWPDNYSIYGMRVEATIVHPMSMHLPLTVESAIAMATLMLLPTVVESQRSATRPATRVASMLVQARPPNRAEVARCLENSAEGVDFYGCVSERAMPEGLRRPADCLTRHADDAIAAALCSSGEADWDEHYRRARRIVRCMSGSNDPTIQSAAQCIVSATGDNRAIQCLSEHRSAVAISLCLSGTNLSPEASIVAECVESTSGEPNAFVTCAGGRLLARELAKCENGIGTEDGCFGPNNEFRLWATRVDESMRAALGENNELYRAFSAFRMDALSPDRSDEFLTAANRMIQSARSASRLFAQLERGLGEGGQQTALLLQRTRSGLEQLTTLPQSALEASYRELDLLAENANRSTEAIARMRSNLVQSMDRVADALGDTYEGANDAVGDLLEGGVREFGRVAGRSIEAPLSILEGSLRAVVSSIPDAVEMPGSIGAAIMDQLGMRRANLSGRVIRAVRERCIEIARREEQRARAQARQIQEEINDARRGDLVADDLAEIRSRIDDLQRRANRLRESPLSFCERTGR